MIVNISEAKAHLSALIEKACLGEEVIIAKNNKPLVVLMIHTPKQGKRSLGLLSGQFEVPDDFNAPDAEIEAMFYGDA